MALPPVTLRHAAPFPSEAGTAPVCGKVCIQAAIGRDQSERVLVSSVGEALSFLPVVPLPLASPVPGTSSLASGHKPCRFKTAVPGGCAEDRRH